MSYLLGFGLFYDMTKYRGVHATQTHFPCRTELAAQACLKRAGSKQSRLYRAAYMMGKYYLNL